MRFSNARGVRTILGCVLAVAVCGCGSSGGGKAGTDAAAGGTIPDAAGGGMADAAGGTIPDAGPDARPDAGPTIPAGCNPVGGEWDCLFPFPSDVYLVDDATQPTGRRLEIPPEAQIADADGAKLDMLALHPADGFSTISQIMALVPADIAPGQLVTLDGDYTVSLRPESRTVLIEADTGARVLHIAEADPRALDPARRAVMIRPQVRLKEHTRYIVGIRRLNDVAGADIAPPPSFVALRAGAGAPAALQARYDADIFPALATAGAPREGLLLAWDFTTRSDEQTTRDMLDVRRMTMEALSATPPVVKDVVVQNDVSDKIATRLDGTIQVPLFMETPNAGALLHRGPDGRVAQNGTANVPFLLLIPRSVAAHPEQAHRFLQFGHGFFGLRQEIADNFVFEFADRAQMVVAAVDWWGMSAPDSADVIGEIINDPPQSLRFVDRLPQGMANFIALSYAAKTSLHDAPETQIGGQATWDPAELYFYGISQGGILGGTYLALAPNISRGVLSVGGGGFAMLMDRSRPFVPFLNVIAVRYPDALDQQKFVALSQLTLDRIDPMQYAPHLITDLYPGSPPSRRVLMQIGVGDAQVPNLGEHTLVRSIGIPLLQPSVRQIPGVETVDGPTDGSALEEFSFGIAEPLPGTYATPAEVGNGAHEGVRRSDAGQRQIDTFFHPDGRIEHTCDGVCDPE